MKKNKNLLKRRTILVIAAVAIIAFSAGAIAFPPIVTEINPISSGRFSVTGVNTLRIYSVIWVTDPSTSTLEGLQIAVNNTDTRGHVDIIIAQVSCLSSGQFAFGNFFPPKPFTCASGQFYGYLPPGVSSLPVNFDNAVAPEQTQIEDIGFIVQQTT